ncbi:MAG: type II and III secretion system protein, partial [Planctomycetes bacterium]|nr:type II and III secretion system protein [Planctomycetota bacterium]
QVTLSDECRNGVNFESITSFRGNEIKLSTIGFANPAASSAFFLETTGAALTNLVELLKTTTDAKTLASPRLLVVSGQEARIQVGEQLGFRITTTTQTSSLESVQFLDVGVVLTVTPRITRDGRVLMQINPKVSTGQVNPETGLPAEETTEVETDIFLDDGQGMVIGGLIQEQDSITQSKIPWLGDLPYVGLLFQKRRAIKDRTEIIVTLIPHIQPYSPNLACRESVELMRTQERLTEGPLNRLPRTYEPKLYDSLTNPRPFCLNQRGILVPTRQSNPELIPLPPAEAQPDCLPTIPPTVGPAITLPLRQASLPVRGFG